MSAFFPQRSRFRCTAFNHGACMSRRLILCTGGTAREILALTPKRASTCYLQLQLCTGNAAR